MSDMENDATVLVGKFEDAHVFVGDVFSKEQDPNAFKKPLHDITYKDET